LKVQRESEGVVTPGEALLEIGNARSLEVEVEVLSDDAVRIKPASRVVFERWGGEEPLEGRVRRIEPVAFTKISALGVEEQRVLVIVDITSPEETWQRLGHGYRVEASFVIWEDDAVLQAPASALFRYDGGWAVFVMEDGFARRRPVNVGNRTGLTAQIIGGLDEGQFVITHPDETVEDGTEIERRIIE
jgi:HlyD family secretion protein